jgi:hypothetical protein
MPVMKKRIPEFQGAEEERQFWATADRTEYVDWKPAKGRKLVHLKPSLRTISFALAGLDDRGPEDFGEPGGKCRISPC